MTRILGDVLHLLTSSAPQFLNAKTRCHVEEGKMRTAQAEGDSVVDFAENYSALYQDELQSGSRNLKQVSIFCFVAWSDADPLSYVGLMISLDHYKKVAAKFLRVCQVEFVSRGQIKHRIYYNAQTSYLHTFLSSPTRTLAVSRRQGSTSTIEEPRHPPFVSSDKDDSCPPLIKTRGLVTYQFQNKTDLTGSLWD
ncbi:unnamed protein product [Lepeophtheirus salmonis]|uniref:(salmon louse) hypothetical protein n=1 Tax=Lepeophtheirus salmonis TaxID=72036 RepID=A0A7R8CCC1_LEPSM|nr:unnamed protein product [Lepeophtheirus salmonis]CAF2769648.1 unnamed protein product [Lepeophtheirus salmonis]